MALTVGTKLGPYEVLGALGAGGMGEVYRARDTRLDRTVAIKILPEHLASDPGRRARFEREAHTISGLSHPNICALYDIGDQDGIHYVVLESSKGEPSGTVSRKVRCQFQKCLRLAQISPLRSTPLIVMALFIATSNRLT